MSSRAISGVVVALLVLATLSPILLSSVPVVHAATPTIDAKCQNTASAASTSCTLTISSSDTLIVATESGFAFSSLADGGDSFGQVVHQLAPSPNYDAGIYLVAHPTPGSITVTFTATGGGSTVSLQAYAVNFGGVSVGAIATAALECDSGCAQNLYTPSSVSLTGYFALGALEGVGTGSITSVPATFTAYPSASALASMYSTTGTGTTNFNTGVTSAGGSHVALVGAVFGFAPSVVLSGGCGSGTTSSPSTGTVLTVGNTYLYNAVVNVAGAQGEVVTGVSAQTYYSAGYPVAGGLLTLGLYVSSTTGAVSAGNPLLLKASSVQAIALVQPSRWFSFNSTQSILNGYTVAWSVSSTVPLKLSNNTLLSTSLAYVANVNTPGSITSTASAGFTHGQTLCLEGYPFLPTITTSTSTTTSSCPWYGCPVSLPTGQSLGVAVQNWCSGWSGLDMATCGWILTLAVSSLLFFCVVSLSVKASKGRPPPPVVVIVPWLFGFFIGTAIGWLDPVVGIVLLLGLSGLGAFSLGKRF